jgi:hypothetical protein
MFTVLQTESWRDAIEIADSLTAWVFRGHLNAAWAPETSLFRAATAFHYPLEKLVHAEEWMLREFKRRAHHYVSDPPPDDDKLEWLALIQHFGGPTRLLDFSYSFYVSAFFAMERAQGDAAVWAIDRFQLETIIATRTRAPTENENIAAVNRRHIASFLSSNRPEPIVANMEPERLNERLSIQQGLFLFPCGLQKPFVSMLEETFDLAPAALSSPDVVRWEKGMGDQVANDCAIVKIVLPRAMHAAAMRDLDRMNMNSATLFPGLDGFARSLHFHLRTFEIADLVEKG